MACADPEICKLTCENPVGCSDTAYARLVMELLPVGERHFPLLHLLSCLLFYVYIPDTSLFLHQSLCVFPPRAARFDDGGNDRCPHVLSDLHLQQRQHHFHHGSMEEFQISCIRVGTHDCGQVCDHIWTNRHNP